MRKLLVGIVFAVCVLNCGIAVGEEETEVNPMKEVVVTATRTETSPDKLGGNSVTVITAEDIEAKKQTSVEEILKGTPGLDVAANGGPGTLTAVFMRGADSKNTLILVDGIMMNDPSGANRGANLANLMADNIERIEIVRGPMSVMYGSNATAGVINIITKKGKKDPSFYLDMQGGSYGTWKGSAGASGATEKVNYSLAVSGMTADGYSIANDDNDRIPHAGNTSEKDGYENLTFSGKVGVDISPDFGLSLVSRYIDSETDMDEWGGAYASDAFDKSSWPYAPDPNGPKEKRTDSEQTLSKVNMKNSFFDNFFESNLSYQLSKQERNAKKNDGTDDNFYNGDSDEIAWQGDLRFESHNVSFGASYFTESMESTSQQETDADIISYRLQDQFMPTEAITVIAGVRVDDHDKFGDHTTFRLAPSYSFEKGTTLKASYGTGFRAPSLFELYSPNYGNENLEAEESAGWDVGIEQVFKTTKFGVTYFDMVFDNRIEYGFATSRYTQSDGKTKTSGVEAYAGWAPFETLEFLLNYTYTESEDPDGERLRRRPYNKFLLNTRYSFLKKGTVNLDIHWVDTRTTTPYASDSDGNSIRYLDAYSLVNASTFYNINQYIQVYGRIDNLFDEFYEECWSYATPGISGYAGFKLTY